MTKTANWIAHVFHAGTLSFQGVNRELSDLLIEIIHRVRSRLPLIRGNYMTKPQSLFLLLALVSAQAFAAVSIVPMTSKEGIARLARSKYTADFAKLSSHYRNQTDRMTCGPVVGSMVLNALRYNTDKAPVVEIEKKYLEQMPTDDKGVKFDPRLKMYTPENFLNEKAVGIKSVSRIYAEPVDGKRDPGISLEEFRKILDEAHGVNVVKINVGTPETASNKEGSKGLPAKEYAQVKEEMKKNLAKEGDYIIANYSRKALSQPGSGHLSPVAAYDEKSDSFLVLDVNPFGGPWAWIGAKDFIAAMNTTDSTQNRGLLLVSEK